jgi:phosphatidylglycerophosphatase A
VNIIYTGITIKSIDNLKDIMKLIEKITFKDFKKAPLSFLISTIFGLGFIKFFGHLINGLLFITLGWVIDYYYSIPGLISFTLAVFVIGVITSEKVISKLKVKDPSYIIIDESLGILTSLLTAMGLIFHLYSSYDYMQYILLDIVQISVFTVIFFGIFDLLKPWIIKTIDIKMNNGLGIMLDDIIAGVFAGFTTFLTFYIRALIMEIL